MINRTTASASFCPYTTEPCSIRLFACGPAYSQVNSELRHNHVLPATAVEKSRRRTKRVAKTATTTTTNATVVTTALLPPRSPSLSSNLEDSLNDIMGLPPPPQKKPPSATSMLVQRLAEYEAIGRISRRDHGAYQRVLAKHASSAYIVDEITKELDKIAQRARAMEKIAASASTNTTADQSEEEEALVPLSILHKAVSNNSSSSSRRGKENAAAAQRKFHVSWEDQAAVTKEEAHDNDVDGTHRSIMEPSDIWKGQALLDEQELQELFVEMCFFARLGFVQPPCCLQCTYRESIMSSRPTKKTTTRPPNKNCQRLVVWRRNAETILHPTELDGNLLIVTCQTARRLLAGETVEERVWDTELKQVVQLVAGKGI